MSVQFDTNKSKFKPSIKIYIVIKPYKNRKCVNRDKNKHQNSREYKTDIKMTDYKIYVITLIYLLKYVHTSDIFRVQLHIIIKYKYLHKTVCSKFM